MVRQDVLQSSRRSGGQAYLSAMALHLAIQRKYTGNESDMVILESISKWRQTMGSEYYEGDTDLESTLGNINRIFGIFQHIPWQDSFTNLQHPHMHHVLIYRAWDVVGRDERLLDDIGGFILHSLQLEPPSFGDSYSGLSVHRWVDPWNWVAC